MKYRIGLDIGIASVGWAVINLDKNRIEDLGVRIFDKAENPKDGKSLATPRRDARGVRRRNRRRNHRIERLKNLIVNSNILTRDNMNNLYNRHFDIDVWDLRVQALERKLTDEELTRILIHIAQRRGFRSNRKSEESNEETGKILKGIKENRDILGHNGYRTIGEMICKDNKFINHKRNKGESYLNTISRDMLVKEISTIFEEQRKFENIHTTEELENKYMDIFLSQRPFATKEQIEKLIGYCTFEKTEKRSPKATYSFQKFMALQSINNIRLLQDNNTIELTDTQRKRILDLCYQKPTIKYKDIRLVLELEENIKFKALYYKRDVEHKKTEDVKFMELKEYHQIKKLLDKEYEQGYIDKLNPEQIDIIGYTLTVCKTDDEIKKHLIEAGFNCELIEVLSKLSFTKVGHLSIKAIKKIIPELEEGYTYDKACENVNFKLNTNIKLQFLASIDTQELSNPVVIRSLSQTRKVINAIIRKYGSPVSINIETARELSKTFEERKEIKDNQNENRSKNEKAIKKIEELTGRNNPRGLDIVKYKLWQEQQGICLYSGIYIEPNKLFDDGYTDIDHILPYSRSIDDSYNNKVLVLSSENRQKGNKTPFEYLSLKEGKWLEFESRVDSNKNISNYKKRNLLKTVYDDDDKKEFIDRNLNDTRYITRYLYNLLRDTLVFEYSDDKKKVHAINGPITSYVRSRLGFNKNRDDGDLHHALDAVIVAITTEQMIKNITDYTKQRELEYHKSNGKFIDKETGEILTRKQYDEIYGKKFPEPWKNFRKEVEIRMGQNPGEILKNLKFNSYSDVDYKNIKPIFVSRMPRRKVTGAAHEASIRSYKGQDVDGKHITAIKTKLENINFDKNGDFDMYDKESSIDLYNAIKDRYIENDKNNKKAFSTPLYKPTKEGKVAPIVKTVKIYKRQNMVNFINDGKGIVDNDRIVRTDVFYKDRKYYLIPVYTIDTVKDKLPKRAITASTAYENWVEVDDSFEFLFSLYPNDLVRVVPKSKIKAKLNSKDKSKIELDQLLGYYKGVHTGTAGISLISNDNSLISDGIGSKTLVEFERYEVDVLGTYKKAIFEERMNFK